jgi:hypothetical protein
VLNLSTSKTCCGFDIASAFVMPDRFSSSSQPVGSPCVNLR